MGSKSKTLAEKHSPKCQNKITVGKINTKKGIKLFSISFKKKVVTLDLKKTSIHI
jgi:hypothetical protein